MKKLGQALLRVSSAFAVCLVAVGPAWAQSCAQRGAGAGSSSLSPLAAAQLAALQPQGTGQLASLQQQNAATQAMRVQQQVLAFQAMRQQEAIAQAEKRQRDQAQRASQLRQLGDRFRAEDRPSLAIQNYRRAVAAARESADGLAAQAELEAYQSDAEQKLEEVQNLITAHDWDEATNRLNDLKRDYSKLPAGSRIAAMTGRLTRLKSPLQSVGAEVASRSSARTIPAENKNN